MNPAVIAAAIASAESHPDNPITRNLRALLATSESRTK